jgi:hypothetical protein
MGDDVVGEGGADGDSADKPWYEETWSYVTAGALGLIVIVVIIVIAVSGDDDPSSPESTTTTTIPQDEADCRGGDADACSELDGRTLNELCDDEVEVACSAVFDRLGGDEPSSDPAPESTSSSDRCRSGDTNACFELSVSEADSLCNEGVSAACPAASATDEAQTPDELSDQSVIDLCPDPSANPDDAVCQERNARGI